MGHYKPGTWNSVCAVCGFKYKADELRKRWDGVYVCPKDWEPRHPLDIWKPRIDDKQSVPWTQHDDRAERFPVQTSNLSIDASITEIAFLFNGASTLTVTLPDADDSDFLGLSVTYILSNKSLTEELILSSSSPIQGSTTVLPDSTCHIRNNPVTNTWIRER